MVYFGKMITKQGSKPEIDNLSRHPYVILHFINSSQHHKTSFYPYLQNKLNFIGLTCNFFLRSQITEIIRKNQPFDVTIAS